MIERLKGVLATYQDQIEWKIQSCETEGKELFFIKEALQMNRGKRVQHVLLTIYINGEEEGKAYKGTASSEIYQGMTEAEIHLKVKEMIEIASAIRNPWYALQSPSEDALKTLESDYSEDNMIEALSQLTQWVYELDGQGQAFINSCEFFLDVNKHVIANSSGIDLTYHTYTGQIELVVTCQTPEADVEVFENYHFSRLDKKQVQGMVQTVFEKANGRAQAKAMVIQDDLPVIFTGKSVKDFFSFYVAQADAENIYKHYASWQIGDLVQESNLGDEGDEDDLVTITLVPELYNSVWSRYVDDDGVPLKVCQLYENGKLMAYHGRTDYTQYLACPKTGQLQNVCVASGRHGIEALKKTPYLEVIIFSQFQINQVTGDFGSEIRLAKYFDGQKTTYVTGGSVSGNVFKAQKQMYLSKEMMTIDNYSCPQMIKFDHLKISS